MLTLRQIEVFRAVMRAQTVVGAAKQMRITQPTVTRTLRRIEDVLGIPLFERSGGRLMPTSDAGRILDEVERAFAELESAIGRAARIAAGEGGSFRFGASPSLGRVLVPRVVAGIVRERPDLSTHLDVLSVSQILDYLANGPGEGVVSLFPVVQGGVRSALVGTGRLVALVPLGLPLAGKALLRARDLADAALIAFEPQSAHAEMMSRFLATDAVTPRRTHHVRFAETAVGLSEAGVGVALVDAFSALSADVSRVAVVPTAAGDLFHVFLHRNVRRAQSRLMRLLEAGLRRELLVAGDGA